jgi:RND superfamily putative drug exporter
MNDSLDELSPARGVARVARWSIAHRWIVIAGWLILTLVGALAAAQSGHRLSYAFDLPGQPGYETNTAILARFGSAVTTLPSLSRSGCRRA